MLQILFFFEDENIHSVQTYNLFGRRYKMVSLFWQVYGPRLRPSP